MTKRTIITECNEDEDYLGTKRRRRLGLGLGLGLLPLTDLHVFVSRLGLGFGTIFTWDGSTRVHDPHEFFSSLMTYDDDNTDTNKSLQRLCHQGERGGMRGAVE